MLGYNCNQILFSLFLKKWQRYEKKKKGGYIDGVRVVWEQNFAFKAPAGPANKGSLKLLFSCDDNQKKESSFLTFRALILSLHP